MKFRVLKWLVTVGIFLAGCSGSDFIKPDQAQIDAYIQQNPDLRELDKSLSTMVGLNWNQKKLCSFFWANHMQWKPCISHGQFRKNGSTKREIIKSS